MDIHERIDRIGRGQHGVWSRRQARAAGWNDDRIDRMLAAGKWRSWFGGPVYSGVGTPDVWLTRLTAAWLRVGSDDAVASRRTAARLWALPGFEEIEALEFVVLREHTPALPGIEVSRTIHLPDGDILRHSGVRVTSATRTLHDLASTTDEATLLVAAAEAWRLGRTDPMRLLASLEARPRLAGNRRLRRVVEQLDPRFERTRSVPEILDVVVLRDLPGLPPFRVNVRLRLRAGNVREADVLFEPNAILELQSQRYHGSVVRRRADAARRRELEADGYAVAELWTHELADRRRVEQVVRELLAEAARLRSVHSTVG